MGVKQSWERFKTSVGVSGGLITLGIPGIVATVIGAAVGTLGHLDAVWLVPLVFFSFMVGVGIVGLIWQAVRPGAVQISAAQLTSIVPPAPSAAIDITETHFRGLSFRISDLARQIPVIDGRIFESCWLFGPAVLVFTGSVDLAVAIVGDRPEDMLFTLEPGHSIVQGPIIVKDCVFRDCHFIGIGIMGQAEDIAQFRNILTRATTNSLNLQPSTPRTPKARNQ
jgi:hypothetical protein